MTMDQIKNTLRPFKNSCVRKTSIDVGGYSINIFLKRYKHKLSVKPNKSLLFTAIVEATKVGEFPEDPSLMCFLKCLLSMMKVVS